LARPKTLRAGLYARVSTHDQQTLPMQLRTMRAYAKQRGWSIGMEVRDVGSGANVRPQREAMLKAARRRELEIIMVWRLDRWGRSLLDLIGTLQELNELGGRLRLALGSAGPDHGQWARLGRHARRVRGVRTRHSAGPCQGRDRTGTPGGAASWATRNRPVLRR
jgi:hypothetical protein